MSNANIRCRIALSAVSLAAVVAGCTVSPEVKYYDLKTNAAIRNDNWVLFQLTDTVITISSVSTTPPSKTDAPVATAGISVGTSKSSQTSATSKPAQRAAAVQVPSGAGAQPSKEPPAAPSKMEVDMTPTKVTCTSDGCDKHFSANAVPVPYAGAVYAMEPVSPFYKPQKSHLATPETHSGLKTYRWQRTITGRRSSKPPALLSLILPSWL
jgi:hypothetical protein